MKATQPLSAARLPNALLTIDTICAMTGLPRTFIYRAKDFPAPVRIGNSRQMRWHAADINVSVQPPHIDARQAITPYRQSTDAGASPQSGC